MAVFGPVSKTKFPDPRKWVSPGFGKKSKVVVKVVVKKLVVLDRCPKPNFWTLGRGSDQDWAKNQKL